MLRSQISPSCAHNALGGLIDNMYMTASELRRAIRAGDFTGPTAGCAAGYVQTNLVVLPAEAANEFAEFCRLNDRPCPLVAQTPPGMYEPGETLTAALSQGAREWVAAGADLRTDVPKYRVFRHGVLEPNEPTDIRGLWRNDFVAFLLGCSFTFENALMRAGLTVRHIALGRNVPMYRTTVACRSAGRFRPGGDRDRRHFAPGFRRRGDD